MKTRELVLDPFVSVLETECQKLEGENVHIYCYIFWEFLKFLGILELEL